MRKIITFVITITYKLLSILSQFREIFHWSNGKKVGEGKAIKKKIILNQDVEDFVSFFSNIRNDMKKYDNVKANQVLKRMDKVIMYNVPDGKKFRGLMTIKCFKNMAKSVTNVSMTQAFALAWFEEILQAELLIYDDIMDGSLTRRGKPCWHLRVSKIIINENCNWDTRYFEHPYKSSTRIRWTLNYLRHSVLVL
ncbi:hypothetical protein B4U80_11824 [Leptotrombidium deliense]|uniref:Farnesyl pyrophosphate synthase n=1 Tax=Leptotrombidium deliense TaxID=299467 RepID=A0A443S267_9ACAR|nr:hypothetical protein B4U80_11824 [Leptotrombidium deliense]